MYQTNVYEYIKFNNRLHEVKQKIKKAQDTVSIFIKNTEGKMKYNQF